MSKFSADDVHQITSFFFSLFTINFPTVQVTFVGSGTKGQNNAIIDLRYNVNVGGDDFYMSIKYYKESGTIKLFSLGNSEMPFKRKLQLNASFTESYIDFERKKNDVLLIHFQNLPPY